MKNLIFQPAHRLLGHMLTWPPVQKPITDAFHKLFYGSDQLEGSWRKVSWLGVPTLKCPFDLWVYQEILYELHPDKIIESGTYRGGSALFLASICDQLGCGQILTIDIVKDTARPVHPRITYIQGDSLDPETVEKVAGLIDPAEQVMVILDADHHKEHVLKELSLYSPFVSPGSYLIVEDTNLNGHPVWPDFGPGPREAVEEFLRTNPGFGIDRQREKFHLTFSPGGYLHRKNQPAHKN